MREYRSNVRSTRSVFVELHYPVRYDWNVGYRTIVLAEKCARTFDSVRI